MQGATIDMFLSLWLCVFEISHAFYTWQYLWYVGTFDLGLINWYKCGSNRGSFTLSNVPYSTDDDILARSKKKLLNTYLANDIMKACYIFNNYDENNCEKVEFLTQCMLDEAAFTFVCRACCVVNDTVFMRRNITRKTNVKAF